jgi:hypothetical protein
MHGWAAAGRAARPRGLGLGRVALGLAGSRAVGTVAGVGLLLLWLAAARPSIVCAACAFRSGLAVRRIALLVRSGRHHSPHPLTCTPLPRPHAPLPRRQPAPRSRLRRLGQLKRAQASTNPSASGARRGQAASSSNRRVRGPGQPGGGERVPPWRAAACSFFYCPLAPGRPLLANTAVHVAALLPRHFQLSASGSQAAALGAAPRRVACLQQRRRRMRTAPARAAAVACGSSGPSCMHSRRRWK